MGIARLIGLIKLTELTEVGAGHLDGAYRLKVLPFPLLSIGPRAF
jgi:hypothetical protein